MSKNVPYSKAHRSVVKHVKAQLATLRKHKKTAKSKDKRAELQRAIVGLTVIHGGITAGCEQPPPGKRVKG